MYLCIHIYIYVYMYTHTYIYIYTHTYNYPAVPFLGLRAVVYVSLVPPDVCVQSQQGAIRT